MLFINKYSIITIIIFFIIKPSLNVNMQSKVFKENLENNNIFSDIRHCINSFQNNIYKNNQELVKELKSILTNEFQDNKNINLDSIIFEKNIEYIIKICDNITYLFSKISEASSLSLKKSIQSRKKLNIK